MKDQQLPRGARQLLRMPAVIAKVGLCRASIYAKISDGSFPKPVRVSERAVAWDSREVDKWIAARVEAAK